MNREQHPYLGKSLIHPSRYNTYWFEGWWFGCIPFFYFMLNLNRGCWIWKCILQYPGQKENYSARPCKIIGSIEDIRRTKIHQVCPQWLLGGQRDVNVLSQAKPGRCFSKTTRWAEYGDSVENMCSSCQVKLVVLAYQSIRLCVFFSWKVTHHPFLPAVEVLPLM